MTKGRMNLSGKVETCVLTVTIILVLCVNFASQQLTTQPINLGLIAAIPWDVANTLRAPWGGPVSIILAAVLACILFLGLLLSPVNYIFGYPSRIYHPARKPGLINGLYDGRSFESDSFQDISIAASVNQTIENFQDKFYLTETTRFPKTYDGSNATNHEVGQYPGFVSSAFLFIPHQDEDCQKLIVCYTHGFLHIFPIKFAKILRFVSKRLKSIPDDYQLAVRIGLTDHGECQKTFRCSKDISMIMKEMLYSLIPNETKDIWNLRKLF